MDLDALMARYSEGVTEAQKREAMQQALAATGFAMLGANTGGGWQGAARALGRGGLLGMGAYNQALGDAAKAPVQQLDVYSKFAQMKAQEQKARESADFSQQLSSVFGAGPQLGNMGPGGPTPANAQRVAPPSQIEKYRQAAAMYAARGDTEGAKRLADIADRMEGEYSTNPQIGMGPNGAQFAQFSNKGGMRTVEGFAPPPDMQMLNLGGRYQAVDKRMTAPGATFDVTMDPAQKDASARGWADINDRRAREKAEAVGGAAAGKVPAGYRWKADGTLEAIPGGPNDTSGKDRVRAEGAVSRADSVISAIDKAIEQGSGMSTGLSGAALGQVPGTPAYDLRRTIDTIKANIGFQELQAMREASPTGGALGQVAVQELNMLQSVLSSVDANQSTDQLQASLAKVKKHFENWKGVMKRAQGQTTGASGGWSITPVNK